MPAQNRRNMRLVNLLRVPAIGLLLAAMSACVGRPSSPSPLVLKIAPQVCATATQPGIPEAGLPYRPYGVSFIQGKTVEDGDFLFDLWLYCDPNLKSGTADSAIAGLGVYAGYYYAGPRVDGFTEDYWGFEPDVSSANGSWGPLFKRSASYRPGVSLSEEDATNRIKNGIPFRFMVRLESPVGVYGAVLQFTAESTSAGIVPTAVSVEPLTK